MKPLPRMLQLIFLLIYTLIAGPGCRLHKGKHEIKQISGTSAKPEDVPGQIATYVKQVTEDFIEERGDKVLTESEHSDLDTAAFNINQMKTDDLAKILGDPEIEQTVLESSQSKTIQNSASPNVQNSPDETQISTPEPTGTESSDTVQEKSDNRLQRDLIIGFGVGLTTLTVGALAGWGLSAHLKSKEAKKASSDAKKILDEAYAKLSDSQKKNLDLSDSYSTLQRSHVTAQKQLEVAQSAIAGLKEDLRKSRLSNENLRSTLESMKGSLDEALENYHSVKSGLSTTSQSLEEARQLVLLREKKIKELELNIKGQLEIEVELNRKLEASLKTSGSLLGDVALLKQQVKEAQGSSERALQAKVELEKKLKIAEDKLLEATENNKLLTSRLQEASESMSRVSTALQGMGGDLGKIKQNGSDITKLEQTLVEDIMKIREGITLEALQGNVKLEEQVQRWQLKLDEAAENGRSILKKLQQMESDHLELLEKNRLTEIEAKAANEKLTEAKLYAADLEEQIRIATDSLNESKQSRILLDEELLKLKSQHTKALDTIKSLETQSNSLNRDLETASKLEKKLKEKIVLSGKQVNTLTLENETLSKKLRQTNELLSAAQSKHLKLETALNKAESERLQALDKVRELDETLQSTQKNLLIAEQALDETSRSIKEVREAIEKATKSGGSITVLQDQLHQLYESETSKKIELKKMEARYSVLSQEFFQNFSAHIDRQNQAIDFYKGLDSGSLTVHNRGSGVYERVYTVGDKKFVAKFESYTTLRNLGNLSLTNYELKEIKVVNSLEQTEVKVVYNGKATAYQKIQELELKLEKKGMPDMMKIYHQLETDFQFYKTEDLGSGLLKTNVTAYGDITNVSKGVVQIPGGKLDALELERKNSMALLLGQVQDYMETLKPKPDMAGLFDGKKLATWSQISDAFSENHARIIKELVGGNYNAFYDNWAKSTLTKNDYEFIKQSKSRTQLMGDFQTALRYRQSSVDMQSLIRQNDLEIETRKLELDELLSKIAKSVTLSEAQNRDRDPVSDYIYKLSLIENYWFHKISQEETSNSN